VNLIELIEQEGFKPVKRGTRWWMSCPLHEDATPSLSISNKDKGQLWHCFSCKKGGGPVEFLSEVHDVPIFQAKREWAVLNGEPLPNGDRELLTLIVESLPPHEYLTNRGVSEDTQKKFHVGYCEDYQALLKQFNLDENTAESLGLFDLTGRIVLFMIWMEFTR